LSLPRIKFLEELKNRNVGRVAILYVAVGYVVLEVFAVFSHLLEAPTWVGRVVVLLVILGFPAALIVAWVYEITPEGLKPTEDVAPQQSIRAQTGRRLDRVIIAVLALALGYFMFDKFWLSKHASPPPAAVETTAQPATATPSTPGAVIPEKSVAVLPFVDMSEKKDQEYFSDGITEELINMLVKVPNLRVPARTSSFYFKGKQTTIKDIAVALGVSHVLEGSVRTSGKNLRITAQLIRVDNGYHLWSETYDRKPDDIFKIQDDIARAVVGALKLALVAETAGKPAFQPNIEAHTLVLQGRAISRQAADLEGLETAADYYRRATQADPAYALAWASLSLTLTSMASNNLVAADAISGEARATAARALALDPSLPEAHGALGRIYEVLDWNFEAALKEYRKRYELDPTASANLVPLAKLTFILRGDSSEVRELFRKAVDLDPTSWTLYDWLGYYFHYTGRLEEAESSYRKMMDLRPGEGYANLGVLLLARGQKENALAEIQHAEEGEGRLEALAMVYHAMGRKAEADAALAELEKQAGGESPSAVAEVYAYRREPDKAFFWLDRSYAQRETGLRYINRNPYLVNLRDDPRFAALLRKLNLPL
jgi:TolB-like protein